VSDHERRNREFWDADADDYQAVHGEQLAAGTHWGVWAIAEAELQILGDVRGLDVLEYGCGGAQWSIAIAREGARPVGLDQSRAQLRHAARAQRDTSVVFPLVCASGEAIPCADGSFDVVFCDHGATSFCDPVRSVPEVARVLRPGGLFAFSKGTLLRDLCYDPKKQRETRRLHHPYFGSRKFDYGEGTVDFHLTYGEWVDLFRTHGFTIERLVELRPPEDATSTYDDFVRRDWARRWPAEEIWLVRKGRSAFGARS
jgi:SAM-dependent methyltransferase